ncbi:MAG TPA: TonB-dependent receptor [Burkholderiales bacterium]|nr:TonB-dependent receptor [Burkholderiales bacterium]
MHSRGVLAAALCVAAGVAFAAQPPVTIGEPVIVTATRFEDRYLDKPVNVSIITAEDIKNSTARTVPELLRQQPGIRSRDNSGSPNVQVDMRGFGIFGDQNTLVLLDGVRISENEQTTVNWAGIPLSAIERIEIMRGSGAVLYGGGATGGTINIITKTAARGQRSGYIYGSAATYGTNEGAAGVSLGGDSVSLNFNGSYLYTDNYRDNNRLRQKNALADLRWKGDRASLSLKAGADDQDLRLPGALSEAQIAADRRQAATPNDFSNRTGGFAYAGGEWGVGAGTLAADLGYREKNIKASIVGSPIDSDTSVWSFSPRFRLPHQLGGWRHHLVVGLDWDDWSFLNTTSVFGQPRQPDAFQRNQAVYLQNSTAMGDAWNLSLGGRLQRVEYGVTDLANPTQSDERKRDLTAYEIGVRYRASAALSPYAKIGTSFRVPNVNDVYNLFTGMVSLLEPQTSHEQEIGIDIRSGPGTYRVALYHMNIDNELFFDPATFTNRNLPPTRRQGVEAEAKWRLGRSVDLFVNYTYAVSEFRSGDFGGVPIAGNEVPLVPRHAANAGAGWAFAPRVRADVVARYVGEQVFDGDETNTFGRKMPSYTVVDLKLTYESNGWLLGGGVKNLLNEKYFNYGVFDSFTPTFFAYPQPERSFFATAQYTFR